VGSSGWREARGQCATGTPFLSRRTFLAIVGLGAVAACSGTDLPMFRFPTKQLYYGAGMPPENLPPFESELGETLPCYRSYFQAGQEDQLIGQVRTDLTAGRMPITSIKPPGPWAETAKNSHWMDDLFGPLGDIDGEFFLAVHHEPENDSPAYGDASDFKAMQSAVLKSAAHNAPNVVIVPIFSSWSFDERSKRTPSEWNVDDAPVYGLDLYNPWAASNGKEWVPFIDKLSLAEQDAGGRPVVVAEYGCRTDASQPGRAAEWMQDAFEVALETGVVAMSYFNSSRNSPDGTWVLDDETFPAFAELVAGPGVARI
jgi:hypothetical protein